MSRPMAARPYRAPGAVAADDPVTVPGVTGAGIDLLEIERLERALERRPRLAERLFTAAELQYARGRARPGQHLAARFCAKEAVAKALHLDAWPWQDIEAVEGPSVVLHGALAGCGV